jgi:RNA polymerase sigma-B factor
MRSTTRAGGLAGPGPTAVAREAPVRAARLGDEAGGSAADRFRRYRATGDRALRNELVHEHRHLAEMAARRFANRGEPLADLRQVALLGLVKAVERYNPDFSVAFSTFAAPTLSGELKRHFRDTTWPVHVTRKAQELHLRMSGTRERLTQELGRSPTVAELAAATGATVDDVLHASEAGNAYRSASLDVGPTDEGGDERARLAVEDHELGSADARVLLDAAVAQLAPREQRLLHLRFAEDRTQSEIAAVLGISQVQVSRLLRASLDVLRGRLAGTAPG